MERVCCIVVTFNGEIWVRKCLDSLMSSSFPVSVIVIDNASTDKTVQIVKENYPRVTCIESKLNLGFGQGNNIGLEMAITQKADYVFLLNQDAWIEENTIASLVNAAKKHTDYGILSPVHLNGSGEQLDRNFSRYLSNSSVVGVNWKLWPKNVSSDHLIETRFVNAAAWFITAACLAKTGGFDPIFYHYGEDDHYAQRARYHGFKLGVLPATFIYHDREQTDFGKTGTLQKRIQKDWTYFLTSACDINLDTYKVRMLKRGTRYTLLYIASIIRTDRDKKIYYKKMAGNIFEFIPKVKKSRKICLSETAPYLNTKS